ncbi:MAG TPA: DUF4199 domain-containing protein [Mucilaginibacter sp.]|nr:DUF4199 domain-containing protein [Mucilaginibacter sp.]
MKKKIIIYGLIAGLIVTSWMIAGMVGFKSVYLEGSMLLGYTTMLLAFSLIYVGIKNYKDTHDGIISFGKAFKIGLMITLIASTIYVLVWMIDYFYFIPDFFEKYSAKMLANLKANGASQAEIQKQIADSQKYGQMYKNPFFNALFTYMEILPVGLIVTIISALILKRKPKTENIAMAN